jgi:Mlc titration factor MtfA (ptsG expression regulator)
VASVQIVTPEIDRNNRRQAGMAAALVAIAGGVLGYFHQPLLAILALAPVAYWLLRRRCLRRKAAARRTFPPAWHAILETRVRFYRALDSSEKERFRQMVNVFLDDVRITGVRTEVDDTLRVLVAASAIIPVFGFADWEYHRLGEVLVYPGSFDPGYHTETGNDANILGLTGLGYLRGVVILSKPSLLEGFSDDPGTENVGVHEFAHLVEAQEVESGLPSDVPVEAVRQWVEYVARELAHPSNRRTGINDYAYTNDREFFAVVSEYFFGSPEKLKAKNPSLYDLLRRLFHQDPASLSSHLPRVRGRLRRNGPCPCGSGKQYQDCCLHAKAGARH